MLEYISFHFSGLNNRWYSATYASQLTPRHLHIMEVWVIELVTPRHQNIQMLLHCKLQKMLQQMSLAVLYERRHEHISQEYYESCTGSHKLRFVTSSCSCFVHISLPLHRNLRLYINDMLHWYHPTRPLRSAAYPSWVPNKNKTVQFGCRLCDTATAVLGSNLPVHLRCAESVMVFKQQLKTHLI